MKASSLPARIIAVHLFNDYSGSPRILAQWLTHALQEGSQVDLHTSGTQGILDEVKGAHRHPFRYQPAANRFLRLLHFLWVQCILFWRIYRSPKANTVVYVNTILPFGAILGARLAGIPVVCHVHEVSVSPALLNAFLKRVARRCCARLIFVSEYVAENAAMPHAHSVVIPNALSPAFQAGVLPQKRQSEAFRVLMLASVKAYKGLHEFADLAVRMPEVEFELVLNGSREDAATFFAGRALPANLTLWPVQTDVHPFYSRADLVVNLSLPEGWVETFGMTALEAMAYRLPVIVPPVGGIAELVLDGECGFHCDPHDLAALQARINLLRDQPRVYAAMRDAAQRRLQDFRFVAFAHAISDCLSQWAQSPVPNRDKRTIAGPAWSPNRA